VTLRLVSYNIRFGGRGRESPIGDVLHQVDADVVVLQEAVDPAVVRTLADNLDLAVIASELGSSVAVLSRVATADVVRRTLRPGRTAVEVALPDHGLRLFGVHLSSGLSRRGETVRLVETRSLLAHVGGAGGVAILGDLNAIAPGDRPMIAMLPRWIRILLRVDGGIRNEVMTALLGADLVDAYRHLHPDEPGATMPALAPSVRLDYALLGADLLARLLACAPPDIEPDLLRRASDHLPLLTVLQG
jgi:exodeoxyribonuclease-3